MSAAINIYPPSSGGYSAIGIRAKFRNKGQRSRPKHKKRGTGDLSPESRPFPILDLFFDVAGNWNLRDRKACKFSAMSLHFQKTGGRAKLVEKHKVEKLLSNGEKKGRVWNLSKLYWTLKGDRLRNLGSAGIGSDTETTSTSSWKAWVSISCRESSAVPC